MSSSSHPKPSALKNVILCLLTIGLVVFQAVAAVPVIKGHHYFSAPTVQATLLNFSSANTTTTTVSCTIGNGTSRAVFIKAAAVGSPAPVDGTTYTANTVFGTGTQIGATGWYCVYNGTSNTVTVTVTGLTPNTNYQVMTVEYNGAAGSEQYFTDTASGNPNNFIVIAPPVITSFTPATGLVGSSVVISGSGFNAAAASNVVFFGATIATVTAASTTSLTVTVPAGANYRPISVLNGGTKLIGYSSSPFVSTFAGKNAITATDISPKVDFTTGSGPYNVVIGDLDGDGKPDLVVVNENSNTISIFRNTSTNGSTTASSFAAKVDFTTGSLPITAALGDFDGDGKLDIAVTNNSDNTVSVFRNTSSSGTINASSFAAKVDFATSTGPGGIAIGDLDGDGKLDIAVTTGANTVSVLRNTASTGAFTAASFAAKFDFSAGASPNSIAIADLDGDGKPDMACTNLFGNNISVFRNTSVAGTISAGSFATKVNFTCGAGPYSIAVGDLDGDGKPELVTANLNGNSISVLQNTAVSGGFTATSFAAKVDFTTSPGATGVAIGDLDGDGKPDLVSANDNNGNGSTISVFRNTTTSGITAASFAAKLDFTTGSAPACVAIGDVDGDGKADLVVSNYVSGTVSVLRNNQFIKPITQATNVLFTAITSSSANISWTNGTGTSRAVFILQGSTGSPVPVNNVTYSANAALAGGTQVGSSGWYCIYNGTGNTASVNSLFSGATYNVMVVEYNGSPGNELYLTSAATGNPATFSSLNAITAGAVTGGITACLGTASASPAIQQFTAAGTGLSNNIVATAPVGFEVSLSAATGYGSTVTLNQVGGTVNSTIVYVRSASTATVGSISGNVVLSSIGNTSQNVAVTGLINSLPTVTAVSNQSVVNGGSSTAVTFAGTANTFSWTNDTPGIGLAASGTGNVPVFTAVNNGSSPVTATITVTPQSSGFAYLPNSSSSSVCVVNTATHTQVATISVGFTPYGVTVTPNGARAYVTNGSDGTVSVINTSTNTAAGFITVGSRPQGIASSPDGTKVYVANYISSTVSVINTATNTVSTTFPVGNNPTTLVVSPDGTKLYTANTTDNTVSVINTATNAITATIPTGSSTRCIAISPDGSRVYVTNVNANTVSVINTTTNTVIATVTVGSSPVGITASPDGTKVYVANDGSSNVSVISTATNTVTATIPVGNNPFGISMRPDGTEVYVANLSAASVSVINTASGLVSSTISISGNPEAVGNFVSAGTGCAGAPITFTITVNPPVPTINASASTPALTSTYGAASAATSFNVSGTSMQAGILVTPPAGFEVSLNNLTFAPTLTVGATGTIAGTTVYVRLAPTNNAGNYSGNIVLTSTNATTANVGTTLSTVNKAALSITATNVNKAYGATLTGAAGSAAFTPLGLKNSETIGSVTIVYGTGSAATAAVGTYNGSVTPSLATGGTFAASNYTITYNAGNITVTPLALTITATGPTKTYGTALPIATSTTNFTAGATATGEVVTSVILTPDAAGQSATTAAGAAYVVTPSVATGTGGFLANNYTITYVPYSGVVSKFALTVSATATNKVYNNSTATTVVLTDNRVNGDVFTTNYTSATFADKNVGVAKVVTLSGITITGGASANYTVNTSATTTANITAATATVTAQTDTKVYNKTTTSAIVPITTGLIGSDVVGTAATQTFNNVNVGTVKILTAAGLVINDGNSGNNYTVNYIANATGVITVATATVTAQTDTRVYNTTAASAVVPVVTGLVAGDAIGTAPTQTFNTATVGTAKTTTAAGLAINDGNGGNNYAISYVTNTTGVITAATLTYNATAASRQFNVANPALTGTVTGFAGSETLATATTGSASFTTTAVTSSAIGTYPITGAGLTATNYVFVQNAANATAFTILPSTNASLANLTTSTGTLAPVFTTGTLAYTASVVNTVTSVTITPTTADATATVKVNNTAVTSGSASGAIALTVGPNVITTKVTAQDGITIITYTITITRAPSANANLANLIISSGTLNPVFATATKNYVDTVANTVTSVTLSPNTADPTATVTVNGTAVTSGAFNSAIALNVGNNTITTIVTAQDGVTQLTYTIIVTRAAPTPTNIIANNMITPNGDGRNDTWVVANILAFPNNNITVFDRAGRTVYTKKGYTNDWGGTFQGTPLNQDTYYYVIDLGNGADKIKGFITIINK